MVRTTRPSDSGRDGVWLARRTGSGPATLRLWADGAAGAIRAESWGPGAVAALEAAPGLAGLLDDPSLLAPRHPLVRELQRRFPGLRLPRTGQLMPALVPAVIEQKVTAGEAHAAYSAIVRRYGEPAPGPAGLMVAPAGSRLAALPYFEFHPLGLERRRAELLGTHRPARIGDRGLDGAARRRRVRPPPDRRVASGPGRRPRRRGSLSATPTPSASATPTSPTWSRGRLRESREPTTRGCWSCSPPTRVSEHAWFVCWKWPGSPYPAVGPRFAPRRIGRI